MYPGAFTHMFLKKLKKEINMRTIKESGIVGKIYATLMSNEFETWHEDEFLDSVEGNDQTPGDIKKDIMDIFNVDASTAKKIFNTLMGQQFETWYDNDFMDYVEGRTTDKNKILKQIKELFL